MGAGGSTQVQQRPAAKADGNTTSANTSAHVHRGGPMVPNPNAIRAIRAINHYLMPGKTLPKGIGAVAAAEELTQPHDILPPPPQEESMPGYTYGWLVEDADGFGGWEVYNDESTQRLEEAYVDQKETCLVTIKMHAYNVNLLTRQQLPVSGAKSANSRAVRRAPIETYTDPITGETKKREMVKNMRDPFGSDADEQEREETAETATLDEGSASEKTLDMKAIASYTAKYPLLVRTVIPHTRAIFTMALGPQQGTIGDAMHAEGRVAPYVLTSGRDGILAEWNLSTATMTTLYSLPTAGTRAVLTAQYSKSGKYMIAGSDDNLARLYLSGKPQAVHTLKGHTHKVYGAAVAAGESKAFTGSMDCYVRIWDVETGECDRSERSHDSHVFSVCASPSRPHIALSAGDSTVLLMHDFRSPNSVALRFVGHRKTLWDCDIRAVDEMQFSSTSMDNTVRLWDPRAPSQPLHVLSQHCRPVHCARYMPNGRGILTSSKDGRVFLCDTDTGDVVWRAKAHTASVFRALYHTDTKTLLTCSADTTVNIWRWDGGDQW